MKNSALLTLFTVLVMYLPGAADIADALSVTFAYDTPSNEDVVLKQEMEAKWNRQEEYTLEPE